MFRIPVKVIFIVASLSALILGAHGLFVYFSVPEGFRAFYIIDPPSEFSKLFLEFEIPEKLASAVMWMSVKEAISWGIPVGISLLGWLLIALQNKISFRSRTFGWKRIFW